jgi:hypothetical protein
MKFQIRREMLMVHIVVQVINLIISKHRSNYQVLMMGIIIRKKRELEDVILRLLTIMLVITLIMLLIIILLRWRRRIKKLFNLDHLSKIIRKCLRIRRFRWHKQLIKKHSRVGSTMFLFLLSKEES